MSRKKKESDLTNTGFEFLLFTFQNTVAFDNLTGSNVYIYF